MKIIAVIGSPRKKGTISRLATKIIEGAQINGLESEIIYLYDYNIKPCIGDWACVKLGKCHLNDDFEKIFLKIENADIIILGSPVYWANVSSVMKNFFDRHTGYAMLLPLDAKNFHKLSKFQKIKTMIKFSRKFGPKNPEFRNKQYIIIIASTVPFKRLMGEVSLTLKAIKNTFLN